MPGACDSRRTTDDPGRSRPPGGRGVPRGHRPPFRTRPTRVRSRASSGSGRRKQRNQVGRPPSSPWPSRDCGHRVRGQGLRSSGPRPAGPDASGGLILYGEWDSASVQQAEWFTVRPDGSNFLHDLRVTPRRARGGSPTAPKILITNDAAVGPGAPLRPAGRSTPTGRTAVNSTGTPDPAPEPGVRRRLARRHADRGRRLRATRLPLRRGRDLHHPRLGRR